MRIRKRQVPLPLSLLSPVPLTDPHLFSRSPAAQPADQDDAISNHCQPSDHLTQAHCHESDVPHMIGSESGSGIYYCQAELPPKKTELKERLDLGERGVEDGRREKDNKSNDISQERSVLAAEANNGVLPPQAPPSIPFVAAALGRWCNGDETVPLKKRRRGYFDRSGRDNDPIISMEIPEKKTICKIDKNCVRQNGVDETEEEDEATQQDKEEKITNNNNGSSTKKSKRGRTIVEGSRCSRVNGRGWRCFQPTLVGYSLCEHHLGKGRFRSMTATFTLKRSSTTLPSSSSTEKRDENMMRNGGDVDEDNDDDWEKKKKKKPPLMISSKGRVKIGMASARSLSKKMGLVADDNGGKNT
ncbi:hypothetical protein Nepgr_020573 [Nepenthes gracilis]|uniref:WRC domain-containing protein n=1 Tax=Nepenthes gracilis TaxID=150966 RepID=A0AAD3XV67_NEPGR|nr:hypothetical protein Nepgr_020573 [Nepenthes gracilis]